MAISAVADDAFEGRVDRAGWLGVERARFRDRAVNLTDHERYEADWPSVGRGQAIGQYPSLTIASRSKPRPARIRSAVAIISGLPHR